jgi:hypothetical protein
VAPGAPEAGGLILWLPGPFPSVGSYPYNAGAPLKLDASPS